MLTAAQGQTLVELARFTLMEKLGQKTPIKSYETLEKRLSDPCFDAVSGVFVTLKSGTRLRGCIGSLEGRAPLREEVGGNALKAAFEDPRFRPLRVDELKRLHIEVSILTPPQNLNYSNADDLLRQLRPGIHGVTLRKGLAGRHSCPRCGKSCPNRRIF